MAIFNFLENFFFISLAITFGLMLMLVYHFKERITISEKRIDTINDVLITVVKELKNIQLVSSLNTPLANTISPLTPFPTTVLSNDNKTNNGHIYYDISELKSVNSLSDVLTHNNKIVVSDVEEEDDDEESHSDQDSRSSESSSDTETENDSEQDNGSDLGENEDKIEEDDEIGEKESVSSMEEEESDEEDEDEEEDDTVKPPIVVVLKTDEIQVETEKIKLDTFPVSEEPALIWTDIKSGPMDAAIDVETILIDPLEARDSVPTTESISLKLDDIKEIVVPVKEGSVSVSIDPSTISIDIDTYNTANDVLGSSANISESSKPPEPEPEPEPVIPVSEKREKSIVPVFNSAKEQKKEVYRKMSIHQLRTIAISSGLSADNKMKKADLIRLLETLDDEEDP
jgi:hypothetical protein